MRRPSDVLGADGREARRNSVKDQNAKRTGTKSANKAGELNRASARLTPLPGGAVSPELPGRVRQGSVDTGRWQPITAAHGSPRGDRTSS
jgi:hypothetical protein